MKNKTKNYYLGFPLIPDIWQILKCFIKQFHQASTNSFWGVISGGGIYVLMQSLHSRWRKQIEVIPYLKFKFWIMISHSSIKFTALKRSKKCHNKVSLFSPWEAKGNKFSFENCFKVNIKIFLWKIIMLKVIFWIV